MNANMSSRPVFYAVDGKDKSLTISVSREHFMHLLVGYVYYKNGYAELYFMGIVSIPWDSSDIKYLSIGGSELVNFTWNKSKLQYTASVSNYAFFTVIDIGTYH